MHHHQGMYGQGEKIYISGSTQKNKEFSNPSYTYEIEDKGNNVFENTQTILFKGGVLDKYRHSGGLQIANGLMAVGIEEYNYKFAKIEKFGDIFEKKSHGFFGSAVHQRSIICFFYGETELKKLRIIKDKKQ